jgi:hypothetical protein
MLFPSKFSYNLSQWLCNNKQMQRLSFWLLSFQVSMTWTSDFRVHLWQYFQLMTPPPPFPPPKKKKIQFLESYMKKEITECFLTLYDSFIWIGHSLFVINCFRNNRTSQKPTNVSQRIFPISKRRYNLAPKSILSLKKGLGPTTQRSNTLSIQWLTET